MSLDIFDHRETTTRRSVQTSRTVEGREENASSSRLTSGSVELTLSPYLAERNIAPTDWPNIETLVKGAVKDKQKFERVEMPKEALLEMFKVSRSRVSFLSVLSHSKARLI